ncbi:tandem-95 repeat protein [Providencia sp. JGM181]|uniref:Ig-like domain-containing protein n=1 Tax=Providencia sp. JGM181 TaxID=2799799 RepID=UPI001BA8B873|nr:Ig-like domain-containing protein [Providencia sp. JGM181]MBS0924825.1 tandem-95 repeat protein [Providencia sp. JGM181]
MSIKKISIKVNNSKETIEQYSVTGGENGAGQLKQPLHINAQKDVNYLLIDESTQFAPENIAVKRVDKNLVIAFEGGDVESPDLIIENYFAENGAIGYQEGDANLIIGQYENGQYFPYVPESAVKADAISQLADGQAAGQAIGGDALPPLWAFNPWWLAALVPLIGIPAVAISGGGGGGGHSKVVDHAPIAGDDSAHAKHNTPVTIHVTANDSDVDGDLNPNSIRIVKEGSKGTVTIGKDGKIIYTPNKGEYGVDTITYVVKDRAGHESNVATITVKIDAAPEAKDDSAATKESTPVTIDMENNYSDKDGDVDHSSLAIKTNGGKGFAKFVNGKLVYQPNKGEVGTDTITYTVTDKNGNVSEDATITINIDAPPVANDDSAKANKATPVELDVLDNDTDLDGDIDPTTLVVVGEPTKGTVKVVDGKLVYTANPDATGQDTITYLVKDKNGNVSNKATVTIDITEPPVANEDKADTRHNTPVEIDVTANDTDLDGDLDKNSVVITQPGTKGTVTIGEDGKLIYTPNKGEHGTDTITYTIKDKNGNVSEEATVTITIDAPPVAGNDVADTRHNKPVEIDITANDTDLDGDLDKNSVVITNPGTKGTVTIGKDGKLIYTPNKGEHGTDTITYTIKDKNGNVSEEATVTVTIDAPPVAGNDVADTRHNKPVEIDITANDTDLDGDLDKNSVVITNPGTKGTVTIGEDGKLIYTPNKGEHGTDTITYTIKDKNGNVSEEATVTVTIDAPPVAGNDVADTRHNKPVEIDITANDTDKDGDLDKNSVVITQPGTKGTVTIGEDGKLIYTPNPGATGTDTITYTIKDKNGNVSEEATVTVTIDAPPVAGNDVADTRHNQPVEIDITANDTDLDGDLDKNSVVITQPGTKGTVTIGEDGKLIYTPNKGEHGTDTITYTIKDKNGNVSNEATVTITIDAPPVAVDDKATTKESVPVTIDVLANDTDLDKDIDPSTLVIKTNGSKGTATIVDGKLVYTPNTGEVGTDTITYQVFDKNGNVSNEATVTINIDAPPVAVDDKATTKESVPVTIDVLANDTDLDKDIDPSTLVIKTNGSKGTATIVDGKLVYTPNAGEVGTDTITYQVFDKNGNVSNEATVTVDIDAAPVAVDDSAKANKATPVEIDVLGNDTDLDNDIDPNTLAVVEQPSQGTVSIVNGKLVYTPNADAKGTDTITYTVKDANGNVSNKATVTIVINEPPVAGDDHGQTKQGVPTVIDVLINDKDPDGELDKSTLHIEKNGSKGTATFDADGKLIYTPKPGATGQDTITYTVKDKDGSISNTATVTIDITPTQTTPTEVFEKGLRTDGTAGDKSPVTVHGVIELSNPTDKPTTPSDIKIIEPTTKLTSGGEPISWESTDNGFVGKIPNGKEVISVKVTDTPTADGSTKVNYEVNLKGLVDHPAGKDSLNIEFGVKNGTDEVKTEIVVHDDKPEASNVELSVEPPVENTFYANLIISLDLSSSMGRDDSGIQGGNTASGMKTRYDAALDSIDSVLSSYEERLNSADAGEVRVSINGFAKQASAIGGAPGYPMDQPYWCTISEAKQIIEGLRGAQTLRPDWHVIGVDTNYDAALQQVISIFQKTSSSGMEPIDAKDINGKLDNTLFVITDGIPNYGNQSNSQDPVAGNGIAPTSPNGFVPGSPNTDIGEDSWKAFLTEKGIRSVAIGIGQDMLKSVGGKTGEEFIKPIAFDGQKGENNDANDVIVLKDMSSLGNILSKYVPNENTIESSFSKANDGKETLSFGADGMKSISIEVDGHTYKYDPTTKGITSDNLDKSMWVDFGQGELAVKTDAGGLLSISLGEKNFGHLTYRPGATRPTGMEKETFTLTLTDNDGTNGKSSISVDISKLKESGNTGLNDTDLTALKLFSPESAMELHGVDTDVNATSSHSTGFMNSSLDALQETQSAII